jgi:preprotein translocase subunit SecA
MRDMDKMRLPGLRLGMASEEDTKKRWLRKRVKELERRNAEMEDRIREWDKVRSKFRAMYMECADILDLPELEDDGDDYQSAAVRYVYMGHA